MDSQVHRSKIHGLLILSCCNLLIFILMLIAYFSTWFVRTPMSWLSINYYLDYAAYNTDIAGYATRFPYDQCSEHDGEHCDELENYQQFSAPLWLASSVIIVFHALFTSLAVAPYYISSCRNSVCLLSNNKHMTILLIYVFFACCAVFVCTSCVVIPFLQTFPYTVFCFYEQYDNDDDVGCSWGHGLNLALTANALLVFSVLFTLALLLLFRTKSSSASPSGAGAGANASSLAEGLVNEHEPRARNSGGWPWKFYLVFFSCLGAVVAYLIVLKVLVIRKPDDGAMDNITNRWDTAKCFQPQNASIPYFDTPQGFGLSAEDVCSFTNPDDTDYEYLPEWWSCCPPTPTCENAYNYTGLVPDANTACGHALAVITKASCHPLATEFTPKTYNIYRQSSVEREDGVFVCALYCKQTWNYCKMEEWRSNGSLVSDEFSDEMDFCRNGLQVQVRNEVFTDHCLDAAPPRYLRCCLSFVVCFIFAVLTLL